MHQPSRTRLRVRLALAALAAAFAVACVPSAASAALVYGNAPSPQPAYFINYGFTFTSEAHPYEDVANGNATIGNYERALFLAGARSYISTTYGDPGGNAIGYIGTDQNEVYNEDGVHGIFIWAYRYDTQQGCFFHAYVSGTTPNTVYFPTNTYTLYNNSCGTYPIWGFRSYPDMAARFSGPVETEELAVDA